MDENCEYRKKIGRCQKCNAKVAEGSSCYCEEHLKKNREKSRKYRLNQNEKMKNDSVFAEKIREKRRDYNRLYRQKHRDAGICMFCTRPVFRAGKCEKHWKKELIKICARPFQSLETTKHNLAVPAQDPKTKADVGAIIVLFNAGWPVLKIADELKISRSSVYYWLKKAAETKKHCKRRDEF